MTEFAKWQFRLNKPDQNGIPLKDHLMQIEKQTGKTPIELEGPPYPYLMAHIWSAFLLLSNSRMPGFDGPSPITYEQIKAFMEVTETMISPREVDIIKMLDRIYMEEVRA